MTPEQDREKKAKQAGIAAEGKRKCDALLANPDFQWFLELAVNQPLAKAEAELHDLKTEKDARENAAHVAAALRKVSEFLANNAEVFARQIPS